MKLALGSCLCQEVKYQIKSKPMSQGVCYCQQCQRSGGGYGSPLIVVLKENFKLQQGTLSTYKTNSHRGSEVSRNFCRACGSHVYSEISDVPGIVTVKAVTLDEFKEFNPQYLVWTQSAHVTCAFPSEVPSFLQNAPFDIVIGNETVF